MGRVILRGRPPIFALESLVLSGRFSSPYHYAPDSAPWFSLASAGDSGSNGLNLSYNGSPTDLGPGLNGFPSAQFEGVHNSIYSYTGAAGTANLIPARIDRFFSRTGYGVVFVAKPNVVNAPQPGADERSSRGMFNDGGQTKLSLNIDTNGVHLCHVGTSGLKVATVAYAVGDFAVYIGGFDGTNLWMRRNRGTRASVTAAPIANPFDGTGAFHVGDNWGGGGSDEAEQSHYSGQILDILTARQPFTLTEEANIVAAFEAKYARSFT
jgi:hypothetical protein